MHPTPEQLARSPRPVQQYLARLEQRIQVLEGKATVGPEDSLVTADPYSDTPRPLGRNIAIRYHWGVLRGRDVHIDVEPREGLLRVQAPGPLHLIVTPQNANTIDVRPVEYRKLMAIDHDNRALTNGLSPNDHNDLIMVSWSELNREWQVSARRSPDDEWSTLKGGEEELDNLMSMARDVATGG